MIDLSIKRVFVCAAYAPETLGAARKIERIVKMFVQYGYRVCLIVTSHEKEVFSRTKVSRLILNGVRVPCIVLFTVPWRPIGKAINALFAFFLGWVLAHKKPTIIWLYNGYLFEMLFMAGILWRRRVLCVIEVEDWMTSRSRGVMNIKNWMDYAAFRLMIGKAALVTCVNSVIDERVARLGAKQRLLFPSFISSTLVERSRARNPFSSELRMFGYFGKLNAEKGADLILSALRNLPASSKWRAIVTGTGPLTSEFRKLQEQHPDLLDFKGVVSDMELAELMASCDVIVNPHRPLEHFGHGVLPFKLTEALATGRVVVGTELGNIQFEESKCIMFFDGTPSGLINSLEQAERFYMDNAESLRQASNKIAERYSERGLYADIINRLI
jgi:glycosyltransferase involved in cell wall biosynthesis